LNRFAANAVWTAVPVIDWWPSQLCIALVSWPLWARQAAGTPGKVEVLLFWESGIVVMILSGAVAIYASYLHLWDVH
jgi:hypothetical protein